MSAIGGKADMAFCGISLSRSLLGVKRTWLVAAHVSAFDPKRTSTPRLKPLPRCWSQLVRSHTYLGGGCMRRREFITLLSSTTVIWPIAAWAQQRQVARVGVLMSAAANDPEGQARITGFR